MKTAVVRLEPLLPQYPRETDIIIQFPPDIVRKYESPQQHQESHFASVYQRNTTIKQRLADSDKFDALPLSQKLGPSNLAGAYSRFWQRD